MTLQYSRISLTAFNDVLARYPATTPAKLKDLDTQRYETIPETLAKRKEDGDAYLEKGEVETLVEWKLKHGTFRPKLLQLVQSNPAGLIQETTRKAFSSLSSSSSPTSTKPASKSTPTSTPAPDITTPLKTLTTLKGIGPATASLLLSVHAPSDVPFFSDELFRWTMWDETGSPQGGWKRGIKYNVKEYREVVERVGEVRRRLGVGAVECERVAWVLGCEGCDVGVDVGGGEGEDGDGEKGGEGEGEEKEVEVKKIDVKTSGKRKAEVVSKAPAEGTRRSTRRKTEGK